MPLYPALLFDLDGVLVDSRRAVEIVWRRWAAGRGLDPAPFIRVAHGRRTSETLAAIAPELDARAEAAVMDRMEAGVVEGLVPVPGARELLAALPPDRWGIVTSGSVPVATLRLRTCDLPVPAVFITGETVTRGKPDPDCYRQGARALGQDPTRCLAIEDAPAGIAAARAAGMDVIALTTTHAAAQLDGAGAIIADLTPLDVRVGNAGVEVEVRGKR